MLRGLRFWSARKADRGISECLPTARRTCDVVVIFAVSDGEWIGVRDLLDSLDKYLDCDYEVLAVDDATSDGTYELLLQAGLWVLRNPEKMFLWGLHQTLARGFRRAVELFEAPIYLKIDPDALVIGHGFYEALQEGFDRNPKVGLLGTYRVDWNGEPRDLSYWRERMARQERTIRKPLRGALANGYQLGDGVQGGAYALRGECLLAMERYGWLTRRGGYQPPLTRERRITEDSLITMLTYAAGYVAEDFGGVGQPFGLWDVGLPMSPEELVAQNRLVVHAIKYTDDVSREQRKFFARKRHEDRCFKGS